MKVLASYPDGRATVAAMNADLAILAGAGREWTERLRRLAARSPGLDIFSEGLVTRDARGWRLTSAGRDRLRTMEAPAHMELPAAIVPVLQIVPTVVRPETGVKVGTLSSRRRRRPVALDRSA
jgi:hypothetical protein